MSTESALSILVVDDEEPLERYATALEPTHDVRTATTDDAALEELSGDRDVDLAIVASRLGDYGTDAIIREVRYRGLACRLLMVDDDLEVDRSFVGVDGRLTRPLDDGSIRAAVHALGTLDRIGALTDRYHRLAAGRHEVGAVTEESPVDGDEVSAVKAELDALVGEAVDAGLAPGLYRTENLTTAGSPGLESEGRAP